MQGKLINQANGYQILPGVYIGGTKHISEIMADLSGLQISLQAYLKIAKGDRIENMKDFFSSFAKIWKAKRRREAIILNNDQNPHPAEEYRVNGTVKNIDEFYEVYDIREGDSMYLSPADRVKMW